MDGPLLIGVDVGTTSVKGALIDSHGQTLKTYGAPYPTARPQPGHAEQDPRHWTRHVLACLAHLTDGIASAAIAGVGLCSQVNTHVFTDANGEALLPAILWQDGRCAVEAAGLDRQVAPEDRMAWWGAPLPIDASHVLSRMAWVRRYHPGIWSSIRWVMAPKDYCILHLTGEATSDPLTSFGIADQSLALIPQLLSLVDGARERLPPLKGITEQAGVIRNGLPGAGLKLVTGTMDAWAGLLGAGVAAEGDAGYLSGTSEVAGIISQRKVPTPGVIAFPECEGILLHAGPTQSGGASVAWIANLLAKSAEEISALAATSDFSRPAPTFLPHLEGERAPLWDIAARASFSGLDAGVSAPELARAVLEGVAFSVRLLLDSLEHSAARTVASLRHAGGGARSDHWCQIRADILGRTLERCAYGDAGVLGAAMLAGVGLGLFGSLPGAASALVGTGRIFEPDASRRAMYDDGFARYMDLYGRLKGFGGAKPD